MFISKKEKIHAYLNNKSDNNNVFDALLRDYLNGNLKKSLEELGLTKIDFHIDWFENMKCISMQGKYKKYYVDLQIYPDEFSLSFDLIEPDEDVVYCLESKEQVYKILLDKIKKLSNDT